MAEHNMLGKNGELAAVDFLKAAGLEILETNWRFKHLEIDIIAKEKNTLVIIEVKTRSFGALQQPADSINKQKIKWLVEATDAYIRLKGIDMEVRFDVISIIQTKSGIKLEHIPDAFIPRI